MDYVEYLGYQYRLIEFDSVETFDDFFTGKKIFLMLLFGDHVMCTIGYRSTQLVIVKHLAIQSPPLIAHQLEQWLTEISTASFSKWENPLVSCIHNGRKFAPVWLFLSGGISTAWRRRAQALPNVYCALPLRMQSLYK